MSYIIKKFLLSIFLAFVTILGWSQCTPSDSIIALGDPEGDGVLNPFFLEAHAGQEIDMTVTVLAPPDGAGEVVGVVVPYTMNYFIVKRMDNMPAWLSYDCPNNCRFDVGVYSCVHVTGTAPDSVPVGDSTVMEVIVDANVDAIVLWIPYDGYEVEDENGGALTIRYKETPFVPAGINPIENEPIVSYNVFNESIEINNAQEFNAINVYNLLGNKIISSNNMHVEMHRYPSGIYFVEVIGNNSKYVQKVVKP